LQINIKQAVIINVKKCVKIMTTTFVRGKRKMRLLWRLISTATEKGYQTIFQLLATPPDMGHVGR
jgi:hypothetical protein